MARKTWATNDLLDAATLNQEIRDTFDFLYNPPGCRVYNNAAISHTTSGTFQALTFNSERYDAGNSIHSTSVNTSRLTIPTVGRYMIGGNIEFASNATGYRSIAVRADGATYVGAHTQLAASGVATPMTIGFVYPCTVGMYFELMANQTSGGALNVNQVGNYTPEFWCQWVGE